MSNILINFAIGSYANPIAMPPDRAKIIGISRHRLSTDGDGVTTLVAFIRCSSYSVLQSRYSLDAHIAVMLVRIIEFSR